jgi:hypothetical protein
VVAAVAELQTIDPAELWGAHPNPYARRHLRFLAAIVHESVADSLLPLFVHALVANPALPLIAVREVLDGGVNETPAVRLRVAARRIRVGDTLDEAAAAAGVNHKVVEALSVFFGFAAAREQRLAAQAYHAAVAGQTVFQFQESAQVGRRLALRLMAEARRSV